MDIKNRLHELTRCPTMDDEVQGFREEIMMQTLYMDCMQIDDISELAEEQQNRILTLSLRGGKLRFREEKIQLYLEEIHLEYQRVMGMLAWEKIIHNNLLAVDEKFNENEKNHYYLDAKIRNFGEIKEFIHWSTLYVLPEVYDALRSINENCQFASNLCLFSINIVKSVDLQEFEAQQIRATYAVIKYLKDEWIEKITQSVRMYLRDIGKGTFDLRQKNPHVYDVIKLQRFSKLMIFLMQDAIKCLVGKSMIKYLELLVNPALCTLNVQSNFIWGNNLIDSPFSSPQNPLFNIELHMNTNGPYYSIDASQYQKIIIERLEEALLQCHRVSQPQGTLLNGLKLPPDLYLSSTGLLDNSVNLVRNKLIEAYNCANIPLKSYANEFNKYLELYLMNKEEYIQFVDHAFSLNLFSRKLQNIKKDNFSTAVVKENIILQLASLEDLKTSIPENIFIGPFNVKIEKLKSFLVNKRRDLSIKLLTMLTEHLKEQLDDIMFEYSEMRRRLRTDPKSIEEVFEIREYIESLPPRIENLNDNMSKLKLGYDIFDNFKWNIPDEDFYTKWQCIGYPRLINEQIVETNDYLFECTEKFLKLELEDEANLSEKIIFVSSNLIELSRQTDSNKVHEFALDAKRTWKMLKECQEQSLILNDRRRLFDMPSTDFNSRISDLEHQFEPYKTLWCTSSDWLKYQDAWIENPLIHIDAEEIDGLVADMQKAITKSIKFFQDQSSMSSIACNIGEKIEAFKPYIGLIKSLRNPGMMTKHFDEINIKSGIQITITPTLNLQGLIVLGIENFQEEISEIADKATKEYAIGWTLDKMMNEWNSVKMDVISYKETGTWIMKVSDEILIMLDEHIQNTQQIGYGPYRAAFETRLDNWESKLKLAQDVIIQWINVQKAWMYLEPIFTAEDISRQLPVEAKKYRIMERNWRRIMKKAYETPFIIQTCADRALLESLNECETLLELVQKGLSDYLETKRTIFPRFYFLSDDELLEILAQTKNVTAVQPHLNKCFENMKELRFEEDLLITRMYSADGEEVILKNPVYPIGNVEDWLGQVEWAMQDTLKQIIDEALIYSQTIMYSDWVYTWPGQVVICADQINWTAHVERAIETKLLKNFLITMLNNLDELRSLIRGQPTDIQRLMLESLITIQVHSRDVLTRLIEKNVSSVNDFNWNSQMRYYWDDSNVKIRAVNAEFLYGYEYLGNNGRLVITPLTERCYLTLTGALHLKFGGAPSGPAGTGKTETTKDLAKAFAIQCVVFNCSDQLDYISMGKFFKGLASAGAWACFDEFNRIDIEVLSVIAQQILTIQQAQQMRLTSFVFEGCDIKLKSMCAVFITMNPGYAGRTELPDNLKALFRPVAMMVPNYALIAEISLFSYGFSEAKTLAIKITTTFKLSSEQLSTQDHYDFGMRAVKTVIAYAGNLKRMPGEFDEFRICLRALKDVNVPKFFKDDLKLFEGILSDLFPGLTALEANHYVLEAGIHETIRSMGLKEVEEQIHKVIQLYETTTVRHGLMLVGPTGTGKTKCYEILKNTCTMLQGQQEVDGKAFDAVETHVLNPKSITLGQLYGEFDVDTHEWTDGILPFIVRAGCNTNDTMKKWYIFDGPVDAVWIENMNTVLDDNKKLCLTSGEIIKLSAKQTIIFEVGDLKVASPATVSRCGMVYLEVDTLGHEALIESWLESLPKPLKEYSPELSNLTYQLLPPAIKFLRSNLREMIATVNSMIIQSYINLINLQFNSLSTKETASSSSEAKRNIHDLLIPWVTFAIIWSVGGSCDSDNRLMFSEWLKRMQRDLKHPVQFPSDGLVYDYTLQEIGNATGEHTNTLEWIMWTVGSETCLISLQSQFHDIEVPTMDSIRNGALIGYLLSNNSNVLCVGPTGSSKTLTIARKLSSNMPAAYISDFITFSAKTSARKVQEVIDSKLEKRRAGIYGPPLLKKQIFFIDDLNMPMLEEYGAQPPLELLRQLLDSQGWYDTTEIGSFRRIIDVNIIGAMEPPGDGRNQISQRVLRHFDIIVFPEMENEAKKNIYGTILKSWFIRAQLSIELFNPLLNATLNLYNTVCRKFLPTPDKSHYTFNLRDLSRIFQGILMVEPEKIERQEELIALWFHEISRVMADRLNNENDLKRFDEISWTILIENFGQITRKDVFGDGLILFGDFCGRYGEYRRIINHREMERVLLQSLEDYNSSTNSPMKIILFEEAMSHICRISRILRQPRGNALLLGMGGSGRQSLTRLSSFLGEFICFQIESKRSYSINDWHDDIKAVMLKAGLLKRSIVFLFSDTQIKDDSYLEDIHNILNSGDVPNIYQKDELERIWKDMRAEVQEAGLPITKTNLFSAYLKNIRSNLHIVVTMSPIGEVFRARIRQFPALVNCSTIDWFHPWSQNALQSVAIQFVKEIEEENFTDSILNSIVTTCQFMHSSTIEASQEYLQVLKRRNYVTPVSYLEMLSNYGKLLNRRKKSLLMDMSRLSTGLNKLSVTEIEVKEMQIILKKMKPELEKAAISTSAVIDRIRTDTIEAEKTKTIAEKQEREATKLKRENEAIRNEANADLSQVKPMLEAAEASLKALNKSDITEVKAMKRPPVGVVLVIEAMCIVNDVKPLKLPGNLPGEKILDYWTPGSQMLADAGHFLRELENFDKTKLTEDMMNKLKYYIDNPSFHPSKVLQVSKACHSLCLWLHAMYNWYFVNLKVEPKMIALKNAEASLIETEEQLRIAMNKLKEVEDGIKNLQEILDIEENKKKKLEDEKKLCEDRMSRAVKLIDGLSGEQKRWMITIGDIKILYSNAVGDILLSSGAIAYLTPFTDTYRKNLLNSWREILEGCIPLSTDFSIIGILGNPVDIQQWHIDGLPRDSFSVENIVLSKNSNRWPLFIDPQRQANKWIKKTEKTAGLLIARMTDKDLIRVIENAVKFGRPCLIENVAHELDSSIDNILMKSVFYYGGQLSIKIGENVIPYNEQFRLYLTTKLPNPHYPPEITVKVLMVNFALTISGLLDQMLSLAVMQERPDLEAMRSELIVSSAEMKKDLKDIEDKILDKLSKSEGSTVDDIDLINTLEASKLKSEEIKIKVASAEITQADIDKTRLLYLPVANRAQILYFSICDLKIIDYMYQYSLEWFIHIYIDSIMNTEKTTDITKRVMLINEYLTLSTYSNVCRSLFERHKLHFAFLICAKIKIDENTMDPDEWKHLIAGSIPSQLKENPAVEWLPERSWQEIHSLQMLKRFESITTVFREHLKDFKSLYDSKEPENGDLSHIFLLNDFQELLLLKCLRSDRLVNAIQLYIKNNLGSAFIESQTIQLALLHRESDAKVPMVFILSSGTDPAAELYKFAENEGMNQRFYTISLGQGQGPRAEILLQRSIEAGNWIFFQNCHLAPSWMPKLESLIETFPENIHHDFRLFLTCTPSLNFPPSILENAIKLTVEPPRGIKANMHRAYTTQVAPLRDLFETDDLKITSLKSLVYSLCLFHSILLERRKFGSLGFNIPYDFSDGDLAICISQLQMFIMESEKIPFEVLVYTAGHINYGGRITDDWDRRCVLTLLHDFYNENILQDNYSYDANGNYQQLSTRDLTCCKYENYLDAIKLLPLNDEPEIFGLHANADISYATAEAYYLINNVASLQPNTLIGSTGSSETTVKNLAEDLIGKIPRLFDIKLIQERYPVLYEESLNTVLQLETKRYNGLVMILFKSLNELLRALSGEIVMNEILESMAEALAINKVPKLWEKHGYPSLKFLSAWMADLRERINFMINWSEHGIPPAFWISGFFFPQAFLTGTLQNFARKHSLSIDTIDFSFQVLTDLPASRPKNGCVVYGLFLEGCRWNGFFLDESHAKVLYSEMKPILLLPVQYHEPSTTGIYNCPVYKTLTRSGTLSTTGHSTNFVLCMEIPSKRVQSHWIKRGVALFCALDY